ncbi:MAG: 50S ribosomal protein L35 [Bacteroidetes bacterium]|nr:50S ribosomal protein L35 [Bacteroidota bacterium]
MPKVKTNKSAKKRFKVTGTGKVLRAKAFARHILTSKSRKRKRGLRKVLVMAEVDQPRVKRMLGM